MIRVLGLLFLVAMTGCASPGITMKPSGRHEIGQSYSIVTHRNWSHFPGPPESWTVDGLALGVLHTWSDLEDGDALFEISDQKMPQFHADFSQFEVAELVADTIEMMASGADVETTQFRPTAFGSNDGFRFEVSYVDDGLPYRGIAAGALRGDKLDLIFFRAPTEHYYDLYVPEIEEMVASIQTST